MISKPSSTPVCRIIGESASLRIRHWSIAQSGGGNRVAGSLRVIPKHHRTLTDLFLPSFLLWVR
jgi:hypothetical protein